MNAGVRPKVGLLALTLELYETLAPGLRASREAWLRQALIPALQPHADVLFEAAVFRREDIESTVARFETAGADALAGRPADVFPQPADAARPAAHATAPGHLEYAGTAGGGSVLHAGSTWSTTTVCTARRIWPAS